MIHRLHHGVLYLEVPGDIVSTGVRELSDQLGAVRAELQVKLFGGADVLLVNETGWSKPTVGKLNCEAAIEVVRAEGFQVSASSLGGTCGLNIRFDTRTGEVRLRRLG